MDIPKNKNKKNFISFHLFVLLSFKKINEIFRICKMERTISFSRTSDHSAICVPCLAPGKQSSGEHRPGSRRI
jgi:hypothetical protein